MRRREFLRVLTGGIAAAAGRTAGRAAAAPAAAGPAADVALRVMTFNIHHAEGTDGRLDVERIARVIRAAEPDLVALQEVDRGTARAGEVDQAAKLGELTGMRAVFGKAIDYQGGEYGNAILSRHGITDPVVHPLPGRAGEERRCLLTVAAKIVGGRTVRLAATHLNHRDADERLAQARAVVERLSGGAGKPARAGEADGPPVPTLLAGDLNAEPGEASIKALLGAFADVSDAADGAMLTWPTDRPRKRIDYVLAAPPTAWRVVSATAIDPKAASDHRPVLCVVELV